MNCLFLFYHTNCNHDFIGTTFTNANLKDTDFTDAYLGPFDLRNLCKNPTLQGKNSVTGNDSFESAGCGNVKASAFKES